MKGDFKLICQLIFSFLLFTYSIWDNYWIDLQTYVNSLTVSKSMELPDAIMAFFTVGVLLAAFIQAVITNSTAKAAVTSANAAVDMVRTMEATAEKQLRAYVHTAHIDLEDLKENDLHLLSVEFKNTGQTPAYNVTCGVGCWFVELNDEGRSNWQPDDLDNNIGFSEDTMSAGKSLFNKQRITISPEVMKNITDGIFGLHVYGVLNYKDEFGKSRATYFNWMRSGNNVYHGGFFACNAGNRTT